MTETEDIGKPMKSLKTETEDIEKTILMAPATRARATGTRPGCSESVPGPEAASGYHVMIRVTTFLFRFI
jgi:hypothetical protein